MGETVSITPMPNNLEAYWMPFTANRQFKKNPAENFSCEIFFLHIGNFSSPFAWQPIHCVL